MRLCPCALLFPRFVPKMYCQPVRILGNNITLPSSFSRISCKDCNVDVTFTNQTVPRQWHSHHLHRPQCLLESHQSPLLQPNNHQTKKSFNLILILQFCINLKINIQNHNTWSLFFHTCSDSLFFFMYFVIVWLLTHFLLLEGVLEVDWDVGELPCELAGSSRVICAPEVRYFHWQGTGRASWEWLARTSACTYQQLRL